MEYGRKGIGTMFLSGLVLGVGAVLLYLTIKVLSDLRTEYVRAMRDMVTGLEKKGMKFDRAAVDQSLTDFEKSMDKEVRSKLTLGLILLVAGVGLGLSVFIPDRMSKDIAGASAPGPDNKGAPQA